MNRLVPLATLLVLILGLLGCRTRPAPKAESPAAPAVTVKAGDLLQEYSTNAVAADAKYKGKLVQVSGKFGSAQKAPLLGYAVQLLPEDAPEVNASAVQCFIVESAEADVANLKPEQMITIQGTCDGQVLGQVKLSRCVLIK
jgi:starvation-inducible outer membrane lipoprotein